MKIEEETEALSSLLAWREHGVPKLKEQCELLGLQAEYFEQENYLDYWELTTPSGKKFSTHPTDGNLYHIHSFLEGWFAYKESMMK